MAHHFDRQPDGMLDLRLNEFDALVKSVKAIAADNRQAARRKR